MRTQTKSQQSQAVFQEKILSLFEKSLTEEQRFLQDVMAGKSLNSSRGSNGKT